MQTVIKKFGIGFIAFVLAILPVFALPTIKSVDDQNFDQNQNIKQVRDITVTADADGQITAGGDIRLVLTTDFQAIWDDQISTVNLSGSAVTAGRFSSNPSSVTYLAKDKVVLIDVATDFVAGESVTISGLFLEGFYVDSLIGRIDLQLDPAGGIIAKNTKTLRINTSTNRDTHEPEAPSAVVAIQTGMTEVKLTWMDPPDMDVTNIQVLRGVKPLPVSGTAYKEVTFGTEFFTDTELKPGITVSYILRATDGLNLSPLSEEVSITLVADWQTPAVTCPTDYSPVCGSNGQLYSNSCEAEAAGITSHTNGKCVVPTETDPSVAKETGQTAEAGRAATAGISLQELQNASQRYSDLTADHWSAGFLARLTQDSIIAGYPDGTVGPDRTINRAELAKIAVLAFDLDPKSSEPLRSHFSDVPDNVWFGSFVSAVNKAGASWTAGPNYFPAGNVSRGEAIWVLVTAAGVEIGTQPVNRPFPDVSTSYPYAAAIAWAKGQGIISGYEDGTFGIRDILTRAQVAKIVVLLKKKLGK